MNTFVVALLVAVSLGESAFESADPLRCGTYQALCLLQELVNMLQCVDIISHLCVMKEEVCVDLSGHCIVFYLCLGFAILVCQQWQLAATAPRLNPVVRCTGATVAPSVACPQDLSTTSAENHS
mmetsp:Transcript_22635/g.49182  ORF Transcript_22635/g.49182 Transcript_22635/m.49182 type:complete len:124 (+) Transcript_22635:1137-1508(+)